MSRSCRVRLSCLLAFTVAAIEDRHTAETHLLALRVQAEDKAVAYTNDGAQQTLAGFVAGADLLVTESHYSSKGVKWHLNYLDTAPLGQENSADPYAQRHAHPVDEVPETCAYDGLVVRA